LVVERPFRNFWHFIFGKLNPLRGGFITLRKNDNDGAEPWQKEILAIDLAEFGPVKVHTDW
jgi:hypothetical protein